MMNNFQNNKMLQMQAEMARFENEIAGQFLRPTAMISIGAPATLRFIPHSLRRMAPTGAQYAPPMGLNPQQLQMRFAGAPVPNMFQNQQQHPRMPTIPASPSSAVIEGAPTRYPINSTASTMSSATFTAPSQPSAPAFDVEAAKKRMASERAGVPGSSSFAATAPLPQKASSSGDSSKQTAAFVSQDPKAPQTKYSQPSTSTTTKPRKYIRTAGGEVWEDTSLLEWDPNDYRLFCGDLGNEVSDELLAKAFRKYPSFVKAKVIREKRTNKTKGFGFISFKDPQDFIRALREMDGKYVGNRPIKLRKSQWKDRNINSVRKKEKEKKKLGLKI